MRRIGLSYVIGNYDKNGTTVENKCRSVVMATKYVGCTFLRAACDLGYTFLRAACDLRSRLEIHNFRRGGGNLGGTQKSGSISGFMDMAQPASTRNISELDREHTLNTWLFEMSGLRALTVLS